MNLPHAAVHNPLRSEAAAGLRALPTALGAGGYTYEALLERRVIGSGGDPVDIDGALTALPADAAHGTLVRLFMLARSVPRAALVDALGTEITEGLIETRLVVQEGPQVRAQAAIIPHLEAGLLMLRDFDPAVTGSAMRDDHVPGVGVSTLLVDSLAVRRPVERALDLGAGSGFLALRASRFAKTVVATDINPRALNFASFSAAVAGIENIEFRLGSFLEPVQGETFDVVLCNPPFVISPERDVVYRHSKMEGDGVCEHLAREIPGLLREDGYSALVFNWHHAPEDWRSRPGSWLMGHGCDVWLNLLMTTDPVSYARNWATVDASLSQDHEARIGRWVEYFRTLSIKAISFGVAVCHRRTGSNWFRADEQPIGEALPQASDQVQRVFQGQTLVHQGGAASVLDSRPVLIKHHQELPYQQQNAADTRHGVLFKQLDGFSFETGLDPSAAQLLNAFDGTRTVRQLVLEAARQARVDPNAAARQILPIVSDFLGMGFLTTSG